ncbi:MAG: hypothetical protein Q4F95_10665 [Oscillospiraceae bacterium]|nr:hypothetical protein [Oscillospiraceae bacterium]
MKYRCPYCGEKTFSLWAKMTTGGMASKGKSCPKCGMHAVHGLKANLLRTILTTIVLILIIVDYFKMFADPWIMVVLFIGVNIICWLANGFIFDLDKNNRKDIT